VRKRPMLAVPLFPAGLVQSRGDTKGTSRGV
jgi:hypothetical protein